MLVSWFIYSISQCLLSVNYMLSSLLAAGNVKSNKAWWRIVLLRNEMCEQVPGVHRCSVGSEGSPDQMGTSDGFLKR